MRGERLLFVLLLFFLVAATYDAPIPSLPGGMDDSDEPPVAEAPTEDEENVTATENTTQAAPPSEENSTTAPPDQGDSAAPPPPTETMSLPWLWIIGASAIVLLLGGGIIAVLLHRRGPAPNPTPAAVQADRPTVAVSQEDFSQSSLRTEPQGVDLDILRTACRYVEQMRARGVPEEAIAAQLSKSSWPAEYVKVALKR